MSTLRNHDLASARVLIHGSVGPPAGPPMNHGKRHADGGAGLVLAAPLSVGTDVVLRLEDRHGLYACPAQGRVAHCAARPEGGYACGVAFTERLTPDALGRLLP